MRRTTLPAVIAIAALLSGCSVAPQSALSAAGAEGDSTSAHGLPPLPPVRHDDTLPTLMRQPDHGSDLRRERVVADNDAYTTYAITYRSEDLRISGLMHVPHGAVELPAVVLAHGYQDPRTYRSGNSMTELQDRLARSGYVVLITDYRNHAASDHDADNDATLRTGYTVDVVNAVVALRRAGFDAVDPARIGLIGRSMGGGIAYNVLVTRPGLVKAAVLLSPMSSSAVDDVEILTRPAATRAQSRAAVEASYGSPDPDAAAWQDLSPRRFFDRITEPVQIHHGTVDLTCPPAWTHASVAALRAAGKDVDMHWYAGQSHRFGDPAWELAMQRTVAFLDTHV
ncbi:alpha/beta hydrolase family protein [Mumia sp. DW29H23]|uniref:alpha/beta hydrolase family protein n=1 Tax=Mumia sp. DW29H23 TaxID=3421241 RepID=UPI003D699737